MSTRATPYPLTFEVDYPERELNRVTTGFRIILAIPILIVLGLFQRYGVHVAFLGFGAILFLPVLLMIVFRQKYPRWWFDFNREVLRFETRVNAYLYLLRDEYPSTDEQQSVHVDALYPNARIDINRWLPLVKWFLAIPHYVVLVFLNLAALVVVVIAWFAILFTGRYPRGMFDFVVGVIRWNLRVTAYAFLLITDRYPPFSLGA